MTLKAAGIRGLYAITPDARDTASLESMVRLALQGGTRVVQYRNKSGDRGLKLEQGAMLRQLCLDHSARFIVNDDIDLALEIDADGVHLGIDDGSAIEARGRLGEKLLGVSCYNSLERAIAFEAAGADYVAFGAFFASPTKPGAATAPLELLRRAKSSLSVPVVAIGGITPENAALLTENGADALAVISALFYAPDVATAAANFSKLFS